MEEPAWRALSSTAQALYPWVKFEWRGVEHNNNGRISLSVRQAAEKLGVRPDTAARAFHDLVAKGFLVQTSPAYLGTEGAAKSPSYELTELKMPGTNGGEGSKLYRQWKEGFDFPVPKIATNNPEGKNGTPKKQNPVLKIVTGSSRKSGQKLKSCPENRDRLSRKP